MRLPPSLVESWRLLKSSDPGSRFEEVYQRRQQNRGGNPMLRRVLFMGLGAGLIVAGFVLLAMPGPGLLVSALGFALVAGEFRVVARALDRVELALRAAAARIHESWRRLRPWQRLLMVAIAALVLSAAALLLWKWLL